MPKYQILDSSCARLTRASDVGANGPSYDADTAIQIRLIDKSSRIN